ncbi:MAG: hypothetical protein HQ522_21910 [Bacteroidetes bacterium]|nr:hypothetical protein [Bacteroidota bacterium]
MILRTLKSNRSINLLLFPLIGIAFWLKSLLHPFSYQFFAGENDNVLFASINNITENLPFVQVVLSLVMVILIAVIVQVVNDRFSFIRVRTKLPATLFIVIVSGFTQLHTLHPVFLAAIFLLLAIYSLFDTFEKTKPYPNIFNAGFLVGVGTLFYFNLVVLLPAFFIGITVLTKENRWRGFIILLIGFFGPFIFAFTYAILTEQTLEMLKTFEENIVTPVNHFRANIPLHGLLSVLILITLTSSIKILQQYDSKKVSTRKYFTFFLMLFLFSMLSFAFIPATSQEMLVIVAIPLTYLISNFFVFMKSRFWSEFLFILLLAIVIFMQFSDKFILNG